MQAQTQSVAEALSTMPWAKIDDNFIRHPKFARAGQLIGPNGRARAIAMWLESLLFCRTYLTKGRFTRSDAAGFLMEPRPSNRARVLAALVTVGALRATAEGWIVHDYDEYYRYESEPAGSESPPRARNARDRVRDPRTIARSDSDPDPDLSGGTEQRTPSTEGAGAGPAAVAGVWQRVWTERYPTGIIQVPHARLSELARVAEKIGMADLIARMDRFLADDDPFLVKHTHGLGLFVSRINSYADDTPPANPLDEAFS